MVYFATTALVLVSMRSTQDLAETPLNPVQKFVLPWATTSRLSAVGQVIPVPQFPCNAPAGTTRRSKRFTGPLKLKNVDTVDVSGSTGIVRMVPSPDVKYAKSPAVFKSILPMELTGSELAVARQTPVGLSFTKVGGLVFPAKMSPFPAIAIDWMFEELLQR